MTKNSIVQHKAAVATVLGILQNIPGIVACQLLVEDQKESLDQTEMESNRRLSLLGLEIVNEGIRDVSSRQCVVAIAHSPQLRHPPGPILVLCSGDEVVGEEIWQQELAEEVTNDANVIVLGRNLRLYRDSLAKARGREIKVIYRPLRFPELEGVNGLRDVASITVNTFTHLHLSKLMGWDVKDPTLGTVLIGFNIS